MLKKRQKNIMVGLIVWAGLLIVVLYSPIGSPGLYSTQNYFVVNQSVIVHNGTILNAPKSKSVSDNNDNDLNIPEVNTELTSNHPIGSYLLGSTSSGASTYGSMQTSSYQNSNSGSGGMGIGGSFIASGRSSGSSVSSGSGIIMTNGIAALSTTSDLSTANTRQSIINTDPVPSTGGTSPGGDPTGDPIPVGDGWGLFLLMGMSYSAFKMRFYIRNEIILKLFVKSK